MSPRHSSAYLVLLAAISALAWMLLACGGDSSDDRELADALAIELMAPDEETGEASIWSEETAACAAEGIVAVITPERREELGITPETVGELDSLELEDREFESVFAAMQACLDLRPDVFAAIGENWSESQTRCVANAFPEEDVPALALSAVREESPDAAVADAIVAAIGSCGLGVQTLFGDPEAFSEYLSISVEQARCISASVPESAALSLFRSGLLQEDLEDEAARAMALVIDDCVGARVLAARVLAEGFGMPPEDAECVTARMPAEQVRFAAIVQVIGRPPAGTALTRATIDAAAECARARPVISLNPDDYPALAGLPPAEQALARAIGGQLRQGDQGQSTISIEESECAGTVIVGELGTAALESAGLTASAIDGGSAPRAQEWPPDILSVHVEAMVACIGGELLLREQRATGFDFLSEETTGCLAADPHYLRTNLRFGFLGGQFTTVAGPGGDYLSSALVLTVLEGCMSPEEAERFGLDKLPGRGAGGGR